MKKTCENCEPIRWSPGGSYCFYHKKELCSTITPHCYRCGVELDDDFDLGEQQEDNVSEVC